MNTIPIQSAQGLTVSHGVLIVDDETLTSRLAQGPLVVLDPTLGAGLPVAGTDPYGRRIPDLRPYLGSWSPLSESGTWEGALDMARPLCVDNGDFWEVSASRLVAAAMWVVRKRGSGTTLADVLDLTSGSSVVTLIAEIDRYLSLNAGAATDMADARLARRAIADLVAAPEVTVDSVRRLAVSALTVALSVDSATKAWDAADAIDIDAYLAHSNGTIAIFEPPNGETVRPIAAFVEAVGRRLSARDFAGDRVRDRRVRVLVDGAIVDSDRFDRWCPSSWCPRFRGERPPRAQLFYATQDAGRLTRHDILHAHHLQREGLAKQEFLEAQEADGSWTRLTGYSVASLADELRNGDTGNEVLDAAWDVAHVLELLDGGLLYRDAGTLTAWVAPGDIGWHGLHFEIETRIGGVIATAQGSDVQKSRNGLSFDLEAMIAAAQAGTASTPA